MHRPVDSAKKLPESADSRLLIVSNARAAAARFTSKESIISYRCAAARHNPANARNHYGWGRRHAFVSADERSCQTRSATRGKISHCRYSHQQLFELWAALDLCAHAIQQHVVASPYSSELQIRQFLAQLCRYHCRATNARRFTMVPGDSRRGSAKHALFPRAPVRLLPDFKRRPTLPHGFSRAPAPAHPFGRRHHVGHETGPSTSSLRVRHHAKRSRSPHYSFRRKADRRDCSARDEDEPGTTRRHQFE